MIEIEKRLILNKKEIIRMLKDAKFLKIETLKNTYYDDSDFTFLKKRIFLRLRNNKYELKTKNKFKKTKTSQYKEIEGANDIKKFLKIPSNQSMLQYIKNNLKPLLSYTIYRKTYQKNNLTITIDHTKYKEYSNDSVEIEKVVQNESQIKKAEKEILNFIKSHQIGLNEAPGKIISYFKRQKPKIYKIWSDSKIR
jgi:adenylate cyclase class IV